MRIICVAYYRVEVNINFIIIAADGVALGAAVSTSKTEVEVIVFIAIMLHKVIKTTLTLYVLLRSDNGLACINQHCRL